MATNWGFSKELSKIFIRQDQLQPLPSPETPSGWVLKSLPSHKNIPISLSSPYGPAPVGPEVNKLGSEEWSSRHGRKQVDSNTFPTFRHPFCQKSTWRRSSFNFNLTMTIHRKWLHKLLDYMAYYASEKTGNDLSLQGGNICLIVKSERRVLWIL